MRLEILLAAGLAHVGGREVGVHARAVPVGVAERLAVELDVDAVFLGQPQQQVARHPDFVGGLLGALAEDLEFPLALRHFGIDAFVVDAGGEAELRDAPRRSGARCCRRSCSRRRCSRGPAAPDSRRRGSRAGGRPCRRSIPARSRTRRRGRRGWSRACSRHAESCRRASSLRTSPARRSCARCPDRRATGFSTQSELRPSACMVELPSKPHSGSCSSVGKLSKILDLRFAAQVGDRRVAVQPDVFEPVLCHCNLSDLMIDDEPNLTRLAAKGVVRTDPATDAWRSSSIKHANAAQTRATAQK